MKWRLSVSIIPSTCFYIDDPVEIGGDLYALGPLLCPRCVQRMVLVPGEHPHLFLPLLNLSALSGTDGIQIMLETWRL